MGLDGCDKAVVQARKTGEFECITAGHKDADLWIYGSMGTGMDVKVIFPKEHTTLAEKACMRPNRSGKWP